MISCMVFKGLPDAMKVVFHKISIQCCMVHQIRNSIKYISSKDTKIFMNDLKEVYKVTNEIIVLQVLDLLDSTWENKYPIVI